MTSNGFTLADPNDHGMLDVVGFGTSLRQLLHPVKLSWLTGSATGRSSQVSL
jgi:hypothetical protein